MCPHARRLTGALFALWFALYLGAPQLVHPCPAHAAAASAAADEHATHHGGHGAPADQTSNDQPNRECCCPGPQCGASALVAVAPTLDSRARPQVVDKWTPRDDTLSPRPRAAHLLPLSTAPPAPVA
ncbi:MAG: hypothetical protein ACT4P6_07335 [Gemmatimonadaceae bacterium]